MIDLRLLTPEQVERFIHLQALLDRQNANNDLTKQRREYYAGEQDIPITTNQRDYLGFLENVDTWSFNIVAQVVDAVSERLSVNGFTVNGDGAEDTEDDAATPDAQLAALLWEWWTRSEMESLQNELYRDAVRDGQAFVLVTWNEEEDRPEFFVNTLDDGSSGVLCYRDSYDNKPVAYSKYWWQVDPLSPGSQGTERKTVYLRDQVRKYKRGGGTYGWQQTQDSTDATWPVQWLGADGLPAGFAMWGFFTPDGSDMTLSLLSLQDGLNAVALDILAASAAAGFPIVSIEYDASITPPIGGTPDSEDEEEPGLEIAPGRYLELYGGRMNQIPPANLGPMIETMWSIVAAMSATSNVPQYRLRPMGGSDVPSGESLKQLESALVSKVIERQRAYASSWSGVMKTAYRLAQRFSRQQVPVVDSMTAVIRPVWADANIRNEATQAQVGAAHVALGVPAETVWQEILGYSPEQIAGFVESRRRDEALKVANIAAQLRGMQPAAAPAQPAPATQQEQQDAIP
jgi:hypothetical protein